MTAQEDNTHRTPDAHSSRIVIAWTLHGVPVRGITCVSTSIGKRRCFRERTSVSTPGLSPRTAADPSCTDAQCRGQEDRRGSGQSALSRSKAELYAAI